VPGVSDATRAQSNLEIIFVDWLDAMRCGDVDRMAARLAPEVVHQGVRAGDVCPDRDAVLARLRARGSRLPAVTALELIEAGDHVVMSVRAEGIGVPADDHGARRGSATIVFTLRAGLIVRMQDYLSRAEALAVIGCVRDADWQ
jgi:hypothetical protein